MPLDPKTSRELAKTGRLWLLSLLCATAGAGTIAITESLATGVLAFLIVLATLGPLLYVYEKKRRPERGPSSTSGR